MKVRSLAGIATLFLSLSAFADGNGLFLGGSVGYANLDEDEAALQGMLTAASLTGTVDADDFIFGWKFFGGYNFNEYLGVEAGYVNYGKEEVDFTITAPVAATGTASVDLDGFTANAVVSYPVTEHAGVFGKVGALFWNADASATIAGISGNLDDDGTDLMIGVGVKYNFNNNITFRGEWERAFNVSDDENDVDLFSIGVQYNFDLP